MKSNKNNNNNNNNNNSKTIRWDGEVEDLEQSVPRRVWWSVCGGVCVCVW